MIISTKQTSKDITKDKEIPIRILTEIIKTNNQKFIYTSCVKKTYFCNQLIFNTTKKSPKTPFHFPKNIFANQHKPKRQIFVQLPKLTSNNHYQIRNQQKIE